MTAKDLVKTRRVIQPTSFTTPSRPVFGDRAAVADSVIIGHEGEWKYTPPLFRRMGERRNPLLCSHEKKRLTDVTMRWRCVDCGIEL